MKTLTDSKHMFCNVSNRYWNDVSDIGGIYVDEERNWYIERITKLINQCDDIEVLKIIHRIVEKLIG